MRYLDELRGALDRRIDADDLIAEVGDHLLTSVDRRVADGMDPVRAQEQALGMFGEPALVARVFATEQESGVIMATSWTQRAGRLLQRGAAAWATAMAILVVVAVIEDRMEWEGLPSWLWLTATLFAIGGGLLVFFGALGLLERHGGGGRVAAGFLGLGAVAPFLMWFVPGWSTLIAIGALLLARRLRGHGLAPDRSITLLAVGAGVGAGVAYVVAMRGSLGGDSGLASWEGFVAMLAIALAQCMYAAGLFELGGWLRSEVVANDPDGALPA